MAATLTIARRKESIDLTYAAAEFGQIG